MKAQRAISRNCQIAVKLNDALNDFVAGNAHAWEKAVEEFVAPDVEYLPASSLESGSADPYVGHGGMLRFAQEIVEHWPLFYTRLDEVIDLPPDRTLMLGWATAEGEGTRGYASQLAALLSFRDGKLVASHGYLGHAEALAAIGRS